MKRKETSDTGEIIRRFLTKGEVFEPEKLRDILKEEGREQVRERLLRLRKERLYPDHEAIWLKIQDEVNRRNRRRQWGRYLRYAAIFLLPLTIASLFLLNERMGMKPIPLAQQSIVDTTEAKKVYLLLSGGEKVELSVPGRDTVRTETGEPLVIDTAGMLVYKTQAVTTKELIYHTIVVPRGGEYRLLLSDGSRIWLNANSELTYPLEFASGERRVFLKGEGYFEVQPDTTSPFLVEVNHNAVIEVLGTAFNISAYPENDKIFTTLVRGSVRVTDLSCDTAVILKPNQQVALVHGEMNVKEVNAEDYITWVHGRFYFEQMPLEEIMLQLARWYDLHVFWANEELKSYEFTGVVWRYKSAREIFDMIEKTTKVRFTISDQMVLVDDPL